MTNAEIAVARLEAAGYKAETCGPKLVKVQDPYQSNRGNGFNIVTLRAEANVVWKFVDARN